MLHVTEVTDPDVAPRLADLARLTFPLACPPGLPADQVAAKIAADLSIAAFVSYLTSPDHLVMLAHDLSGDVGYTMVVAGEPADPLVAEAVVCRPTAELSKVYTVRRVHGLGVASQLVTATFTLARERYHLASLWLGVNQGNERAQGHYRKHGFTTVGTRRFRVGEVWCDDFVMERAYG